MAFITVAIAHRYPLISESLSGLIQNQRDMVVSGSVYLGSEVVDMVHKKKADILLFDANLEERDGLDIMHSLKTLNLKTRVLVLLKVQAWQLAQRFVKAGASGCLAVDGSDPWELIRALRKISAQKMFLSPEIEENMVSHGFSNDHSANHLSEREFQVLRRVASGNTTREIAQMLCIGSKTVDTHRYNMLRKLGLRNNTEATRFAIRTGLVQV